MQKFILVVSLILCLLDGYTSTAQQAEIAGVIRDDKQSAVVASVSMLNAKDSSWVRTELSDDRGAYRFLNIAAGEYIISATSVGYKNFMQPVSVNIGAPQVVDIVLRASDTSLSEVTVTGKKPFIEMGLGKITVNIEGSTTTAGSTVLELMRRLPNVVVDQDGNISMHGKQGVLVLIDDRPTYLSGTDLADYLKTITAEEIAQMELITQPAAKYDAAGNTGIINIKLRKNKKAGWNGTLALSYGQGVYFNRNESILVNYRHKKLNLLFNASDMEAIGFADWHEQLNILDPQSHNMLAQKMVHSNAKERFSNTALRLAADYDIGDKTKVGVSARGTYHPNSNNAYVFATIKDYTANTLQYNHVSTPDGFIRKDVVTNAYLSEKFSKTSNLDINFDYLTFSRNEMQNVVNTLYDAQLTPLADPFIQRSRQTSSINVYSIKADQACTFKTGIRLETGLKSSWVTSGNDARYWLYHSNVWDLDTVNSNHFLYRENINAAYFSLSKSFGTKWEIHGGLRAEQTNAEGLQSNGSTSFSKNYISLFPTAFVSYKCDSSNQFEINYGRRIDRPGYSSLNPFVSYSYQDNYAIGNPQLRPQFTNNVELKHSYKNWLITSLEFSNTRDVMQGMLVVDNATKNVYNIQGNIKSNNSVVVSVAFNKDLFKWWSFNASGVVFYADFTGTFNNADRTVDWHGYSADMSSRFDFGKGWKAEVSAFYVSSGRWSFSSTFEPNGGVEFGLSKRVKDHLLLKFYANDPLYLFRLNSHSYGDNYWIYTQYKVATRLFTLSVNWTFGGNHENERNTGSTEEAKRMKIE